MKQQEPQCLGLLLLIRDTKDAYKLMVKKKIDDNEADIVKACQNYLQQIELGDKHPMTPDIDGILSWL